MKIFPTIMASIECFELFIESTYVINEMNRKRLLFYQKNIPPDLI